MVFLVVVIGLGMGIYIMYDRDAATEVSSDAWWADVSANSMTGNFLGFVKSGTDITISANSISVNDPGLQMPEEEILTVKVKGIYVTGLMAGSSHMDDLITLVDETELNAMVIDVKNDMGNITYEMNMDSAWDIGAGNYNIPDMKALMAKLKEHDIYTIARIVCFKDPYLAADRPDLAVRRADGSLFTDSDGLAWVNPYNKDVWKYLTDLAAASAEIGFDEIQFDYVRFPVGNNAEGVDYGVDSSTYTKEQAITDFLDYAAHRLHDKNVRLSADVFGTIIGSEVDKRCTGQNYQTIGSTVDVVSPMIYPSHYRNHVFGLDVPDAHPYETILYALNASSKELEGIDAEERASVRPWLQGFTATWVPGHIPYGGEEIRKQIQAVYDAGYDEWILWNASNHYLKEGLEPES